MVRLNQTNIATKKKKKKVSDQVLGPTSQNKKMGLPEGNGNGQGAKNNSKGQWKAQT